MKTYLGYNGVAHFVCRGHEQRDIVVEVRFFSSRLAVESTGCTNFGSLGTQARGTLASIHFDLTHYSLQTTVTNNTDRGVCDWVARMAYMCRYPREKCQA